MCWPDNFVNVFLVLILAIIQSGDSATTTVAPSNMLTTSTQPITQSTKKMDTTNSPTKNSPTNIKDISVRAVLVVAAVSGLVIAYFILRAICSRRRRNRNRRYGMLKENRRDGSNMEMRPLSEGDDDDDDDDLTLFDASQRKLKR